MRRRIAAWVALFAMCFGAALPAHAYLHLRLADAMGGDLCTGGTSAKPAPSAPDPGRHVVCDACAGCTSPAAPATARAPAVRPAAYVPGIAPTRVVAAAAHTGHFLARAPPALR